MFNPEAAFKFALNLQARPMQIEDLDTAIIVDIKAAPSNYSRNLNTFEEVVVEGREFVIAISELSTFGEPKRGHKLIDVSGAVFTISEVKEMYILTKLVGYRVRTQ